MFLYVLILNEQAYDDVMTRIEGQKGATGKPSDDGSLSAGAARLLVLLTCFFYFAMRCMAADSAGVVTLGRVDVRQTWRNTGPVCVSACSLLFL